MIFVDNTNIKQWEASPYYAIAKAKGAIPIFLQIDTELETCVQDNVHGCPAGTIKHMAKRFEPGFPWHTTVVTNRSEYPKDLAVRILEELGI